MSARDHGGDVERYEQLRGRALAGDPGGWRGGLAVLQHRGVAAWLGAWRAVPAAPAAPGPARRDVLPPNGSTAVPPNGPRTVWCMRWPVWRSARWPAGETR